MDIEALVRPMVEADGLEFVEVTFGPDQPGGPKILRVTVDKVGGLSLDQIATTSGRLSRRLDLEGFEPGRYLLEVTSPGIERPLRDPRDFQRKVGEKVKVKVGEPTPETIAGRLTAADEEGIVITTKHGEREVAYDAVVSARTVFEWGGAR